VCRPLPINDPARVRGFSCLANKGIVAHAVQDESSDGFTYTPFIGRYAEADDPSPVGKQFCLFTSTDRSNPGYRDKA